MKKQKNIPVSKETAIVSTVNSKAFSTKEKTSNFSPPNEETLTKLNAIAKEYPFCVNFRQANTYFLL